MIKHINKIAIEVLRDRFADYDWHSIHYDEEYRMIVKALQLAKNNESLHLVSDYKKLNIHECLNDLENIITRRIPIIHHFNFIKSVRYEFKKAIDKMICCR